MQIKPRTLLPQPTPSVSYMVGPTSGRNAATTDRNTVNAAMALAA